MGQLSPTATERQREHVCNGKHRSSGRTAFFAALVVAALGGGGAVGLIQYFFPSEQKARQELFRAEKLKGEVLRDIQLLSKSLTSDMDKVVELRVALDAVPNSVGDAAKELLSARLFLEDYQDFLISKLRQQQFRFDRLYEHGWTASVLPQSETINRNLRRLRFRLLDRNLALSSRHAATLTAFPSRIR